MWHQTRICVFISRCTGIWPKNSLIKEKQNIVSSATGINYKLYHLHLVSSVMFPSGKYKPLYLARAKIKPSAVNTICWYFYTCLFAQPSNTWEIYLHVQDFQRHDQHRQRLGLHRPRRRHQRQLAPLPPLRPPPHGRWSRTTVTTSLIGPPWVSRRTVRSLFIYLVARKRCMLTALNICSISLLFFAFGIFLAAVGTRIGK